MLVSLRNTDERNKPIAPDFTFFWRLNYEEVIYFMLGFNCFFFIRVHPQIADHEFE